LGALQTVALRAFGYFRRIFKPTQMKKNYTLLFSLLIGALQAQIPVIDPISGPAVVCSAPAISKTFSTSATNAPTYYTWNVMPSNGVTGYGVTTAMANISFPFGFGTYTVYCTATNNFGTSNTVSHEVVVEETPDVTFSGSNTNLCQGSSTTLMASSTMQSASSTLTYNWSPSTGLNTTSGWQVTASPNVTTTYTVLLTFGQCVNSRTVTVNVQVCTGLNYFGEKAPGLTIFPNPSSTSFSIRGHESQRISILNQLGQSVRTVDLEEGRDARVEGLTDGVYFIMTRKETYRIVITR
jgi:hypothetical protein